MSKRLACILLGLFGVGMAVLLGHEWGTNDHPLWRDVAGLAATTVIFFAISVFLQWAMKALNSKDDD